MGGTRFLKEAAIIFCLTLFGHFAYATVIVVIVTPSGVWIGADAYRGNPAIPNSAVSLVCKIHQVDDYILLKYGNSEGFRLGDSVYSTDKEVEDELKDHPQFEIFKKKIAERWSSDIEEMMRASQVVGENGEKSYPLVIGLF